MSKLLQGTYTAIITPFTDDNRIDWETFEKIIDQQIEGRVEGLVFVGTTGESPTLTFEEHHEILRRSVLMVNGRCQVIHGTGSNNTQESVVLTKASAEAGADAHLVINPYYNRPTQEGLYRHFTTVVEATDRPVIIYNIQGRTAVNLETSTLLRLAQHPNIRGVKEASGNMAQIIDVIRQVPDDFCVLSGDDALTLPFMACGGDGLISVVSNAMPRATSDFVRLCLNEEWPAARAAFYALLGLMRITMIESNPIPIKVIMHHLGYGTGRVRLPLCEPTKASLPAIQQAVELAKTLNR